MVIGFLKNLWQHDSVKFITRTVFYFLVFVILLYLYGYSGMSGVTFIYNEF
ncbi:teichoic acid D-Ala incorporation-associated protein DltX [Pediococcus acidilactici]|nr:teichoic acid D-Ala incorporation-associated protein DltX [Pediococcus acidilactici]